MWNQNFPWDAFLSQWTENLVMLGLSHKLFPGLLELHWTSETTAGLTTSVYHFTSRHLQDLSLELSGEHIGDLSGVVDCLHRLVPPITSLTIRLPSPSLTNQSSIDKAASEICSLLSALPALKHFVTESWVVSSILRDPSEVSIPHLQKITMFGVVPSAENDTGVCTMANGGTVFPNLRSVLV
jgi:hypothetical protein